MECMYVIFAHLTPYPLLVFRRESLKAARPQPSGYRCAVNEEAAHNMFHEYMWNSMLVFATTEE